jgi:hypothetical protein
MKFVWNLIPSEPNLGLDLDPCRLFIKVNLNLKDGLKWLKFITN